MRFVIQFGERVRVKNTLILEDIASARPFKPSAEAAGMSSGPFIRRRHAASTFPAPWLFIPFPRSYRSEAVSLGQHISQII